MDYESAITSLYVQAETRPPSTKRCITPLAELVGALNVASAELRGLTTIAAAELLLRRGGIVTVPGGLDREPLAGYVFASLGVAAIFVEQSDLLVRRRFSAAHELGHYLLHFRPQFWGSETDDTCVTAVTEATPRLIRQPNTGGQINQPDEDEELAPGRIRIEQLGAAAEFDAGRLREMETEANQFAAELLMPSEVTRQLAASYSSTIRGEALVWRLSTDMLVSKRAMRERLKDLGILEMEAGWRPPNSQPAEDDRGKNRGN